MTRDTKILQIILDNQVEMRKKMEAGFKSVNERLDKQGAQLAYLEDDAPTREEHDEIEGRVRKLERKMTL